MHADLHAGVVHVSRSGSVNNPCLREHNAPCIVQVRQKVGRRDSRRLAAAMLCK